MSGPILVHSDGSEEDLSLPRSPTIRWLLNPTTGAMYEFDEADAVSTMNAILRVIGSPPSPPTIDYERSDIVPILQTGGLETTTIYMVTALPGQQLTAEETAYNTSALLYEARLTAYLSMFPNLYAGAGPITPAKPMEAKK
jgi:hypothetical protein